MTSPFQTRTLAEIYARQGHLGEALTIYESLVDHAPSDLALARRLGELRDALAGTERRSQRVEQLRLLLGRVKRRRRPG